MVDRGPLPSVCDIGSDITGTGGVHHRWNGAERLGMIVLPWGRSAGNIVSSSSIRLYLPKYPFLHNHHGTPLEAERILHLNPAMICPNSREICCCSHTLYVNRLCAVYVLFVNHSDHFLVVLSVNIRFLCNTLTISLYSADKQRLCKSV